MSETILNELSVIDIDVVEIRRSAEQRYKVREIYEKNLNVVGKDIKPKALKTRWIENFGTPEFDIKIFRIC